MGFLSALRKFLHPPSPHSSPLPHALFPTRDTDCVTIVSEWANSIQEMEESQACRLLRIVHCRAKSPSHQEFLLVYIRHPSGKDTVVFADRDTLTGSMLSPSARGQANFTPICDRIRLSPNGTVAPLTGHLPDGWSDIHTVNFPKAASKAPSVAHLAVLLTVVHRHLLPSNTSAEERSGWFAYCVTEILKEIFSGASRADKASVRVPYGGMKVDRRDTVDTLMREFRPAWEDFLRRPGGRTSERKPTPQSAKKKEHIEPFVDMLRAMNT